MAAFVLKQIEQKILKNFVRSCIYNTTVESVIDLWQQMTFLSVSANTQCLEADMLKMRRWVVTNILDSERAYLSTLDVLLQVCSVL